MMIAALIGKMGLLPCQCLPRSSVMVGAFDLARQLTLKLPRFAEALFVKLCALVAPAFVIHEKILQSEIETADFTRTGFGNEKFLLNAEHKPQPAHLVTLNR